MKDHQNGATYCDIIIYQNDEPDTYGNNFAVKQGMTKEARDAGEKSTYIGNGKWMQSRQSSPPPRQAPRKSQDAQWAGRTGDPLKGNKDYVPPQGGSDELDDVPF